jgi:hypothetical protein
MLRCLLADQLKTANIIMDASTIKQAIYSDGRENLFEWVCEDVGRQRKGGGGRQCLSGRNRWVAFGALLILA